MVKRNGKRKQGNPGPSTSSQQCVDTNSDSDVVEESDDGDGELLSMMPKRVKNSDNIINIAQSTRNLSRDQICLLFIEVAKRPDQNYEFDLSFWLQKFEALSIEPNFPEAALVLVCAGQIYCRKIDTLYDFIMKIHTQTGKAVNLCEQTKRDAVEIEKAIANNEPVPKKKRVVKKKKTCEDKNRIITNPFELFGGDMIPNEIEPSEEPLHEHVVLKHKEKLDDSIKYLNSCERLKRKLMILKILKQARRRLRSKRPIFNCEFPVQSDNHDILNYANEELVDLDDEIVAGTRRDYFVFMGMINRKTHTLNLVHNFNEENVSDNNTNLLTSTGATLLPPEYVERVYNVKLRNPKNYYTELRKEYELWNSLGPERHEERERRCILIAYQKAIKLLDEKNVIEHLRTSKVITETQYNEAINRLTEQHTANNRTLSPIQDCIDNHHFDTSLPQNEDQSINDSGIGTSIVDSQSFERSIDLSQSINLNQSTINQLDDVFNSTLESFSQSLGINMNVLSQEHNSTNKFTPAMIVEKLVNSELRISVDEGISCTSRTSSPLPRLSDLDPMTRSLLSPKVQLIDICDPLTDSTKIGLKIKLNQPENDIFYIENKLLHAQCFKDYPTSKGCEIPSSEVPIELNFLCLSEKMLRRKCKFALPNEFRTMKIKKINEDRCYSPISNEEDFCGFPDIENSNPTEIQKDVRPSIQANTKNTRSFSQDSGIEFCNSPPHNLSDEMDANQICQREPSIEPNAKTVDSARQTSMFDKFDEDDNIVERITEWYSHLAPILKASKERSYFDIHAYGREIVQTFPEAIDCDTSSTQRRDVISFDELMSSKQKDCTARYFLSMLQLANNGNVEIIPPPNRTSTKLTETSELKIRLLNREIRSEIMDDESNFDNYEPSAKIRKIGLNRSGSQIVNPIHKIIKTCTKYNDRNVPSTSSTSTSRDSKEIFKKIEMYKNSSRFNNINPQSLTADELISIASHLNPNKSATTNLVNSEFSDAGFQSLPHLSLSIGDG